jgi:hypothetical protein
VDDNVAHILEIKELSKGLQPLPEEKSSFGRIILKQTLRKYDVTL